jgi:multidrug efflux pump subunit AcrB
LINEIPVVVTAVLVASLVESFLILPNHMRHALVAGARDGLIDKPSVWFNRGFAVFTDRVFTPVMQLVVSARYLVVAAMLLFLSFAASAVLRGDVAWSFFTAPEAGSITGNFAFLPGASRDDARAMSRELARAVDAVAQRYEETSGTYPVVHALTQIGGTAAKGLPGQETMDPDTLGSIDIGLVDADQRDFSAQDFVRDLNAEVVRPAGLALMSFRSQGAGPGGDSLAVNFYGADGFALKAAATDLITALGAYPEVTGLQDSLPLGREDMVLELTPAAADLGFTTDAVGVELFSRLNGITAATFPSGTRSTDVTVGLPASERGPGFLSDTLMQAPTGAWAPLGEIVTTNSNPAFSTINREDGRRLVTITGALAEGSPERAMEIAAALRDDILPTIAARYNLDWDLGGLAVQEQDFLDEAMVGFLLCILGIYLVLSWVFGSWWQPLIVLSVIPFGLIGTVWGHAQFGIAMSLFTIIGLIGMSGIIINDAIVLVTTIGEYARSQPVVKAAVLGTRDRLRPILLTTLTTVLGLAPLMYEESRQSLFLKPTVVTLVYGLSVGFFIVLMMVPSLLVIQNDVARAFASLRCLLFRRRARPRARIVAALAAIGILAVNLAIVLPWMVTGQPLAPLDAVFGDLPAGLVSLLAAAGASLLIASAFAVTARSPRRRPGA